jgi:phospholipase/carboxylesterase
MHQPLFHLVRRSVISTSEKPPLLVLLHGYGSNEEDLFGLENEFDPSFLVLSVRAPMVLNRGSYAWFSIDFTPEGLIPLIEEFENTRQALLDFIDWALLEYQADPSRVILLGFSQGAMMCGALAFFAPEKFKASVLMSGRLLPEVVSGRVATDQLKKTSFLVIHGTQDQVLPLENGREIHNTLSSLGIEHTYQEFPMPHTISDESLNLVTTWVSRQIAKNS